MKRPLLILLMFFFACKEDEVEVKFFPPSELKAEIVDGSHVALTWTDNSNVEVTFVIERKKGPELYTKLADVEANETAYNDTTTLPNTTYTYRIKAQSKSEETNYSEEVSIEIHFPAPQLVVDVMNDGKIMLEWSHVSEIESAFSLERSATNGPFLPLAEVSNDVFTYSDENFLINTSYRYRVKALNPDVDSDYSNIVTAKVDFNVPNQFRISHQGATAVKLTWQDNSQFENGFKIQQSTDDVNFTDVVTLDSTVTNYTVEGLDTTKRYTFSIYAYSLKNTSDAASVGVYYQHSRRVVAETYVSATAATGEVSMSPSANWIAISNYFTAGTKVFQRNVATPFANLSGHTEGAYCVRFTYDNGYLVTTGAKEGLVNIWNTSTFTLDKTISTGLGSVYAVRFNSAGNLLAISGSGTKILIYSFPTAVLQATFTTNGSNVRDLLFFENDTKLISCGNDDVVRYWDIASLNNERTLTGHSGHIGTLALNKTSSLLISGSYEDNSIKVWNAATGSLIRTINTQFDVSKVVFDNKDNIYFTDSGGYFRVVDTAGKELFSIKTNDVIHYGDYNEQHDVFVVYGADGLIKVLRREPRWIEL